MRRPLPPWAPLALLALGVVLFFVLWEVPRESETADTILEAVPFVVFFVAAAAVPFSRMGKVRHVGLAVAIVLALAPWWWGGFLFLGQELGKEPSEVTLTVTLQGEGDYVFTFPAFLDEQDRPAEVHDDLPRTDPSVRLIDRHGAPQVEVEASNHTTWSSRAEGPRGAEWWPTTEWGEGEPTLASGDGPVSFTIEVYGEGRWCGGTRTWSGTVTQEGVTWDQQGHDDLVCT